MRPFTWLVRNCRPVSARGTLPAYLKEWNNDRFLMKYDEMCPLDASPFKKDRWDVMRGYPRKWTDEKINERVPVNNENQD